MRRENDIVILTENTGVGEPWVCTGLKTKCKNACFHSSSDFTPNKTVNLTEMGFKDLNKSVFLCWFCKINKSNELFYVLVL